MSNQPIWKLHANLGDSNFAEYGGMVAYTDETGIYNPEVEIWITPDDCGERTGYVYRFAIEQLKEVSCTCGCREVRHVTYGLGSKSSPETTSGGCYFDHISQYDLGLPYPIHTYGEWFWKDLQSVADFADFQDIRTALHSADISERAHAYKAMADYHGYENFDSYPLRIGRKKAEERYKDVPTHYARPEVNPQ